MYECPAEVIGKSKDYGLIQVGRLHFQPLRKYWWLKMRYKKIKILEL